MTDVEEIVRQNFGEDKEIFDEDGKFRQGVQIVDPETGETLGGYEPSEEDYLTSWEKEWKKLDDNEKERITRGDYNELKTCLKKRTRHALLEHLRHVDRRRIVLIREHLIELAAYNRSVADVAMEIVFICTRLMVGDIETDASLPDDLLVMDEISDSDEEAD